MNISSRHNISSLKNKDEIEIIFKQGFKVKTKYGPIFLYRATTKDDSRKVAILLKKRVGSAVKRNYIKRIIRYFISKNHMIFGKNNRMIFLFNSHVAVSYALLEKEYLRALLR
jgi:ribonuclease P protein component